MERIGEIIRRHQDIDRPIITAEVVGNASWALTGPSYIDVLIGTNRKRVIYRDGAEVPLIGSRVQVVRMSPDLTSEWLALPLAATPVVLTCGVEFFFRVNGRLTEPPDQIPQDGSMGNKTLQANFILAPDCRNVRVYLRSYRSVDGTPDNLALYDNGDVGPYDGPLTGVTDVVVPGLPTTSYYYVQFVITNNPDYIP